jgi:hypothetical protein
MSKKKKKKETEMSSKINSKPISWVGVAGQFQGRTT